MNYAETIFMDSSATYPTGEVFDRLVCVTDCEFSTFSASYTVGNTTTEVTATEIGSLVAGQVMPGAIKDIVVSSGTILISKG